VVKGIGENAYQLDLAERYGKLHSTFHVSLLEPYIRCEGEEPPDPVGIEEDKFLVERILDERSKHGKLEFLIKWLGYPEHESTWEPLEHLDELDDEIAEFRMQRAAASKAKGEIKSSKRQRKEPKIRSQRRPRSGQGRVRRLQSLDLSLSNSLTFSYALQSLFWLLVLGVWSR
jgi:Chromo (CHRromatin Organisation MOdifier) domain